MPTPVRVHAMPANIRHSGMQDISFRADSVASYKRDVKRKIECIETLCAALKTSLSGCFPSMGPLATALRNYLCFELDTALADTSDDVVAMSDPTQQYKPTLEDFERAQKAVDLAESNMAHLEELLEDADIPESAAKLTRAQAEMLLKPALDSAIQYRDMIQRAMEKTQAEDEGKK